MSIHKADNIKDGKRIAVSHGELFLLPVDRVPEGKISKHSEFILSHSKTGHNHILKSNKQFTITEIGDEVERYLLLDDVAQLVHQKTFDIHETRVLAPGAYRVYSKKEYNVREQAMRAVFD